MKKKQFYNFGAIAHEVKNKRTYIFPSINKVVPPNSRKFYFTDFLIQGFLLVTIPSQFTYTKLLIHGFSLDFSGRGLTVLFHISNYKREVWLVVKLTFAADFTIDSKSVKILLKIPTMSYLNSNICIVNNSEIA